jgi:hypothetical protein
LANNFWIRTIQKAALQKLLEWGAASLEASVNQAVLPHVVIVINGAKISDNETDWDSNQATAEVLKDYRNSIHQVPYFRHLAQEWRLRGRKIRTISHLIHRFYSSFKVVRIPINGRPDLLLSQMSSLRLILEECCSNSHQSKRMARLLPDSEVLELFFQEAFDHFSTSLRRPCNFVEASLQTNPISKDIGGNFLQLAIDMQNKSRKMRGASIFEPLSEVVASCLLLHCLRYHAQGRFPATM